MQAKTHRARITGPVSYLVGTGGTLTIPIGPCLVERIHGQLIDIVWGESGQNAVALPAEVVAAAQDHGHLVLLD